MHLLRSSVFHFLFVPLQNETKYKNNMITQDQLKETFERMLALRRYL